MSHYTYDSDGLSSLTIISLFSSSLGFVLMRNAISSLNGNIAIESRTQEIELFEKKNIRANIIIMQPTFPVPLQKTMCLFENQHET